MNSPTWSDLNSESIVPPLGARQAPDLGPVAAMVSCKPDVDWMKKQMTDPRVFPFFNNTLMTTPKTNKGISVAGPYMGSPYAAMILESIIARGAEEILVLGWCGATDDCLTVGDVVLVEGAIVDEGTSCNYTRLSPDLPIVRPDPGLTDRFETHWRKTVETHGDPDQTGSRPTLSRQTIWTTDAIYRETPKKVAHFRQLGATAVEMECSALFSVAKFRKKKIAAILVVSDSVAAADWKPGFRKKIFKQSRQTAVKTILTFTKQMDQHG